LPGNVPCIAGNSINKYLILLYFILQCWYSGSTRQCSQRLDHPPYRLPQQTASPNVHALTGLPEIAIAAAEGVS
jgi:hypothetical protein